MKVFSFHTIYNIYLVFLLKGAFNGVITEITLTYGTDILIKLEMLRMRFLLGVLSYLRGRSQRELVEVLFVGNEELGFF